MRVHKYWYGFTLIEVLVVIVIIAIITTVAVVSYSGFADKRKLENTAQQLRTLTQSLESEALFYPAVMGLRFASNNYAVYRFNMNVVTHTGEWQLLQKGPLVDSIRIPSGIQLQLLSINEQTKVDTAADKPQIVFLPSSHVTSFTLKIALQNYAKYYLLMAQNNGELQLIQK